MNSTVMRLVQAVVGVVMVAIAIPAQSLQLYRTIHRSVPHEVPQGGLLLLGGGEWPQGSMAWFASRAGHGRVVSLGASGSQETHEEYLQAFGALRSLDTVVIESAADARDPQVLALLKQADGIFIRGGDRARYVRWWTGSPIPQILEARFKRHAVIGGTSAGLAVLGRWAYGALDDGSTTALEAITDPMGSAQTLVEGFLKFEPLANVITDSHVDRRQRLGRLVSWVQRINAHLPPERAVWGLGVDEGVGIEWEPTHQGRVVGWQGGQIHWVGPGSRCRVMPEHTLSVQEVPIVHIGVGQTTTLPLGKTQAPTQWWTINPED